MCGISIAVTTRTINNYDIDNIGHRGPDSNRRVYFKLNEKYNIDLLFYRLSIIDLNHGIQPFHYKDDKQELYLLCNGEIYNYKYLINKYNLDTTSDCEVILKMYLKNKSIYDIVTELNGEFAFTFISIVNDKINIYFGRDRFGIRPLFYKFDDTGLFISSEMKGIPEMNGLQVKPRKIYHTDLQNENVSTYYYIGTKEIITDEKIACKQIKKYLINSIRDRMQSERPIGALLSGGLDSSLICGIAANILKEDGKKLNTFSIGMTNDSTDILYARKVADHIDSTHHEIIIPVEEWLNSLENVIKQIETYDITTIRASTGQYLISKWISENTDIKVILNGDGSDELTSGYLYFFNAPDAQESHRENLILLNEIHNYDVLRVDRGISAFGLESRVPFLEHNFVDMYLSIDKNLRNPIKGKRMEKYLLRKAFEDENIIPHEVLFRTKEAFSDGCSNLNKSWYEHIQDYIETIVSDEEFDSTFPSKEAYWYYKIFKKHYPHSELQVNYWMPKWSKEHNGNPSARILNIYNI